tara:strand:+ start:1092 stop:1868 length:777 start_codon:yes stop_codon:yes gene_type:complete
MSILATAGKPQNRPVAITILGDAGLGKTSLAASFPKPIFIRSEDGLRSVPEKMMPDAFPLIKSVEELWAQLTALIREDHDYQTLVIDTITTLDTIFTDHVLESDPKKPKSLNQAHGGYGAGRDMIASLHRRVRNAAGMLMDRGMNVVFVAHAETVRIEPPDANAYTKYAMRMNEKSTLPYIDNVDAIGFIRLETYVVGDGEVKKAHSDGTRQMVCHAMAANVSKNRFGITEPITLEVGVNPFAAYLPTPTKPKKDEVK